MLVRVLRRFNQSTNPANKNMDFYIMRLWCWISGRDFFIERVFCLLFSCYIQVIVKVWIDCDYGTLYNLLFR